MNQSEKIQGFATAEGTKGFEARAIQKETIAEKHFRLPIYDLTLSSMGVGTYLGNVDQETDDLVVEAVVNSIESGAMNVIDTAINYRYQRAERSIGQALKQLLEKGIQRDELFISTKNGYITSDGHQEEGDFNTYFEREYIESGILKAEDIIGNVHCMTPKFLEDQLERSRNNLGIETIDLMYLHNPAESQLPIIGREPFMKKLEQAFTFFEEARQQNKIRFYGLATWDCFRVSVDQQSYLSLEDTVEIAKSVGGNDHGFRFIQLPFNLALCEAGVTNYQVYKGQNVSTLDSAYRLDIGVFTSVPLMQGQLLHQETLPKFENLTTNAQYCLQLARSHPGVLAPLVGHKNPEHVKENIQVAAQPPLSHEQLEALLMATPIS